MLLRFLINKNPVGVKSGYLVGHAVDTFQLTPYSGYLSLKMCKHVR
jgi:hypothetical protein